MYSKDTLDKLNAIEGAVFHSIEHNLDDNTLKIEVVTKLLFDEIDFKITDTLASCYTLTLLEGTMENKFHLSLQCGNLSPIPPEDRFWITYHKKEPMTDHKIIADKIMKSWKSEIFVETVETDVDKLFITFVTNLSLDKVDFIFREALEDFDLIKLGSDLVPRGDGYGDGVLEYKFNKVLQSNYREIHEDIDKPKYATYDTSGLGEEGSALERAYRRKNPCPDCKDGFYYPLIGKPEPCRTCK